ncbi:MAG: alpha/beta hydrolase [Gemmatimonadaceae bacterium]
MLFVWWKQERIVFQPARPPFPEVADARRVTYEAEDGHALFAFVVDEEVAARGVLIAFHGNADLAAWMVPWAREVARRTGRLVLLPEYRGYGGIQGEPTVAGARHDARAALRHARDALEAGALPAHGGRLALYGHSLGSAIASELAAEMTGAGAPPDVLILESPFTSARDMARIVVARPVEMAWALISRVHYDTRQRVSELDVAVWVAHGRRDVIIPARMGEEVFGSARRKGELFIVPDAGHNDVAEVAGESYWAWVGRALGVRR